MGEKLIVGPFNKSLRNDRLPFNIDNDAFPVLINAYEWRGRIKRKRGTKFLTRLQRFFNSDSVSYNSGTMTLTLTNDGLGNGVGNILNNTSWSVQLTAALVPGTITIVDTTSGDTYTDPGMAGILVGSPAGSGTVNYSSGAILITGAAGHTITASFVYYPDLPVMGLEDYYANSSQFPGLIGFDTTYSYNITTTVPTITYDVSFYKNPATSSLLPGYVPKTNPTPLTWNGQNYQQFWTVNYQGALWATNGIDMPFTGSTIGMQFKPVTAVSAITAGPPAFVTLTIVAHGLVVGDFLFLNEFSSSVITGINFQTGYVTAVPSANEVTVELPFATLAGAGGATSTGIAQYLTNRSNTAVDCLRFYDGDPTNGSATDPELTGVHGWVNFMPPLSALSYTIDDAPAAQYYLVGARTVVNFKDRLLFFGPVIQSSTSNPIYLNDVVIYSQVGTPYYTASFTNTPSATEDTPYNAGTIFHPILLPTNQTSSAAAYFEDVTGFGGYISAGLDMDTNTIGANEDALIVGFTRRQTRLLYTGNDIVPFLFYVVNSELGSGSVFSGITMDKGVISKGSRGFIITSQVESSRIDLEIPDEVFEVNLFNNGTERVCAQRDYINEWIYFTYPVNSINYIFPNQTLQYNYREQTWAVFYENYTTYGTLRQSTQFIWATVGLYYPTWSEWNEPWNAGATNDLQPKVIGGNQQGFVLIRDFGTTEESSLYIQGFSFATSITGATQATQAVLTVTNNTFFIGQQVMITGVVGMTQLNGNIYTVVSVAGNTVTIGVNSTSFSPYISGGTITPLQAIYSPNHCLNAGDYIIINGALGTIGNQINGDIFSVVQPVANGFNTNPPMPSGFTYLGNATITRMYIPFIQTKQFPTSWAMARKTRIGPQQYLFTRPSNPNAQIVLNMYLSQDADNPYNYGPIVPAAGSENNTLIYSALIYTGPEVYIQNCNNISMGSIGNGIATLFSFNFFQIFNIQFGSLVPGSVFISIGNVATFTDNGNGGFTVTGTGSSSISSISYSTGVVILFFTVPPTNQVSFTNFQYYVSNIQSPTAASQSQIWHRLNTSLLGDTIQLGFTLNDVQMRDPLFASQFSEIELHGFILDLQPSQILA